MLSSPSKYFSALLLLLYCLVYCQAPSKIVGSQSSRPKVGNDNSQTDGLGRLQGQTAPPPVIPLPTPTSPPSGITLPPQGLYDSCVIHQADCVNHLDVLAAKGFKLILNYGQLTSNSGMQIAYANRAQSLGMKIIWSINYSPKWTNNNLLMDFPDLASECDCIDNIGFITYFVNLVKNHPATWGYYIADEVHVTEHDRIRVYSDLIKTLDSEHPRLFIVAGSNDPMEIFFTFPSFMKDTVDMMGPDYYPYGYIDAGSNLTRYTGKVASTAEYWAGKLGLQTAIVLQAFSQARYAKVPLCSPWPDCAPFPSYEQMKAQRDQVLLNAKPSIILWWTYQDILLTENPSQHLDNLAAAAFSPLPDPDHSPTPPLSPCPIDWNCEDIGNPALKGSQTLTNGAWNIEGSGWDIWTRMWVKADQFRYVWQNFTGDDGEVSARVLNQTNTNRSAKAGIMIRKTFDPISPYYAVYVTPKSGVRVQYRPDFMQKSWDLASFFGKVPVFLKIRKIGTSYSTFTSSDGEKWSLIPNSTVNLPSLDGSLMAGLAVTSRNEFTTSIATLDYVNISVTDLPDDITTTRSYHMYIAMIVISVVLISFIWSRKPTLKQIFRTRKKSFGFSDK